ARIRLRSLLSAVKERDRRKISKGPIVSDAHKRVLFTKNMKDDYTLLLPQMSPIHFNLLKEALVNSGYNVALLGGNDRQEVDLGLKYVNNDACYPSILVVGQIIDALQSGKYDLNKVA